MVTSLFTRLGAVGLSLIAGALIFGVLAGAVVVHRMDRAQMTASSQEQAPAHHDNGKHLGQHRTKKKNGNQNNPGHGGQPKQSDDQGDNESD
ncbi:MAG: hypothetical protein ABI455_11155 [Candidatus Dormiibacterota bacterium]